MNREFYEALIEAYFKENSLVKQQIDSYNHFIKEGMQKVVDSIGVIKTNVEGFEIKLGKIKVLPPRHYETTGGYRNILPTEIKWRNLTYASPVFLEMTGYLNGTEVKTLQKDIYIGDLPVMVKSDLCLLSKMSRKELIEVGEDPDDPGGYFIINGSERVLVSVEDLVPNKVLVIKDDENILARVLSIRQGFRAKCVVKRNKNGMLTVDFPSIPKEIPFVLLLKSLGLTEEDIENNFSNKEYIVNDLLMNMEEYIGIDKEEATIQVAKRISPGQPEEYRLKRFESVINNYLLPHLGVEETDRKKKALYLIRMAERTIKLAYGKIGPNDRDHYGNKRVKLAGALMEDLFRYALQYLIRDITYQASRAEARGRALQVRSLVRTGTFSDRIKYAMATGNWTAGQTGVSQLLDRVSYLSTLSHLRRVISPLSKKHPHFKARDLHGTHWGKICPSETPEGPSSSLVKNLALLAQVTTGSLKEEELIEVLEKEGLKNWEE